MYNNYIIYSIISILWHVIQKDTKNPKTMCSAVPLFQSGWHVSWDYSMSLTYVFFT